MSNICRLGGELCAYFLRGRCSRTRSPEESARVRCQLLEARRQAGAHTLDRLQRLGKLADPADREVARRHLIQKNLDTINELGCPHYQTPAAGGPLCLHQHLIYCILLLPDCQGRCEHFLRRKDPPELQREQQ